MTMMTLTKMNLINTAYYLPRSPVVTVTALSPETVVTVPLYYKI